MTQHNDDDTTQYIAHESPRSPESTLNQDVERLTLWFTANYLQINATKSQAMRLGKSQYPYNIFIGDKSIEIKPTLKILGVTLDRDLSFKPHVVIMLKKAYAKIPTLRMIRSLVTSEVMISLYKAYVLPHLEHCCPPLLGISKVLKNNIERTNHYASKTLLNHFCLALAAIDTLEKI